MGYNQNSAGIHWVPYGKVENTVIWDEGCNDKYASMMADYHLRNGFCTSSKGKTIFKKQRNGNSTIPKKSILKKGRSVRNRKHGTGIIESFVNDHMCILFEDGERIEYLYPLGFTMGSLLLI